MAGRPERWGIRRGGECIPTRCWGSRHFRQVGSPNTGHGAARWDIKLRFRSELLCSRKLCRNTVTELESGAGGALPPNPRMPHPYTLTRPHPLFRG